MRRFFELVSAVAGYGFELLDGVVQSFLMGRGEGPKLNTDSVTAGPAYDGALDQDRGLSFMDIEEKIHLHSCGGSKGTFKATSFTREIQCLTDSMETTLVDEGAGKGRCKSGILSDHHSLALFCDRAAE
jgi:hypothetical protein